jgi:transposase
MTEPSAQTRAEQNAPTHTEQKAERRVFTEEFKRDAVRLTRERGVTQVARDLGIHESVLGRWKKRLEDAPERPFPGHGTPQDPELAQLRRENARLKEDNEIKKAVGIFTVRPQ